VRDGYGAVRAFSSIFLAERYAACTDSVCSGADTWTGRLTSYSGRKRSAIPLHGDPRDDLDAPLCSTSLPPYPRPQPRFSSVPPRTSSSAIILQSPASCFSTTIFCLKVLDVDVVVELLGRRTSTKYAKMWRKALERPFRSRMSKADRGWVGSFLRRL
jgi:hypothetical protein